MNPRIVAVALVVAASVVLTSEVCVAAPVVHNNEHDLTLSGMTFPDALQIADPTGTLIIEHSVVPTTLMINGDLSGVVVLLDNVTVGNQLQVKASSQALDPDGMQLSNVTAASVDVRVVNGGTLSWIRWLRCTSDVAASTIKANDGSGPFELSNCSFAGTLALTFTQRDARVADSVFEKPCTLEYDQCSNSNLEVASSIFRGGLTYKPGGSGCRCLIAGVLINSTSTYGFTIDHGSASPNLDTGGTLRIYNSTIIGKNAAFRSAHDVGSNGYTIEIRNTAMIAEATSPATPAAISLSSLRLEGAKFIFDSWDLMKGSFDVFIDPREPISLENIAFNPDIPRVTIESLYDHDPCVIWRYNDFRMSVQIRNVSFSELYLTGTTAISLAASGFIVVEDSNFKKLNVDVHGHADSSMTVSGCNVTDLLTVHLSGDATINLIKNTVRNALLRGRQTGSCVIRLASIRAIVFNNTFSSVSTNWGSYYNLAIGYFSFVHNLIVSPAGTVGLEITSTNSAAEEFRTVIEDNTIICRSAVALSVVEHSSPMWFTNNTVISLNADGTVATNNALRIDATSATTVRISGNNFTGGVRVAVTSGQKIALTSNSVDGELQATGSGGTQLLRCNEWANGTAITAFAPALPGTELLGCSTCDIRADCSLADASGVAGDAAIGSCQCSCGNYLPPTCYKTPLAASPPKSFDDSFSSWTPVRVLDPKVDSACVLPGLYGESCDKVCPGGEYFPCNNQGVCSAGTAGTGICECWEYYGKPDCSVRCPKAPENPCSGHGMCDDGSSGTGTCFCFSGYALADCSKLCSNCSGHGTCSEGSTGDGLCSCEDGWSSNDCEVAPIVPSETMSNSVTPSPSSSTSRSSSMSLDSTSTVAPTPTPPVATASPCPNACSQRGTCNVSTGVCSCVPFHALPDCSVTCPGFELGSVCSGHGGCFDGSAGNASCACRDGFTGANCSTPPPTSPPTPAPQQQSNSIGGPNAVDAACSALGRQLCEITAGCYWSEVVYERCAGVSELAAVPAPIVDGYRTPAVALLGVAQTAELYAWPGASTASLFAVPVGYGCNASQLEVTFDGAPAGAFPFAFAFRFPPSASGGRYSWCLRLPGGAGVQLNRTVLVHLDAQRRLEGCSLRSPQPVYDDEPFDIVFEGAGFSRPDKVAVVGVDEPCRLSGVQQYDPVAWGTATQTSIEYRLSGTQRYAVCYGWGVSAALGGGVEATSRCNLEIVSTGMPPWTTPSHRAATLASIKAVTNIEIPAENTNTCRSLYPGEAELLHPERGAASFGTAERPYGLGEQCLIVIDSQFLANSGSLPNGTVSRAPATSVALRLDFTLAGSDSTARVFVPGGSWSGAAAPPEAGVDGCVASVPGYALFYERPANERGVVDLRLPVAPAVVAMCSGSQAAGGRAIGVSYEVRSTHCPGDCKDAAGVVRGTCVGSDLSARCQCDANWVGDRCGEFVGCLAQENSPTLTGSGKGVVRFGFASASLNAGATQRCGYQVVPDSSRQSHRGPLGLRFRLLSGALRSGDCSRHYIRFVGGPASFASGLELRRVCPYELHKLSSPWLIQTPIICDGCPEDALDRPFEGGNYIEIVGDVTQDRIEIEFTSVALSCPGTLNGAGYVSPGDECGGLGRCIDVGDAALVQEVETTKKCVCEHPLASTRPGRSCDTCAFGRDPAGFPGCAPSLVCDGNCSGRGRCEGGRCECEDDAFGGRCEYDRVTVPFEPRLLSRSPLDEGASGDAVWAGRTSPQLTSCSLFGRTCVPSPRGRGRPFGGLRSRSSSPSLFGRRQQPTLNSTPASSTRSDGDAGVELNLVRPPGSLGDFALLDAALNTSRADINLLPDTFTVMGWVKLRRESNGFVLAIADDARTPEGRFPALDAAFAEVRDRSERPRVLDADSLVVYVAVFANGPERKLDLLVSRRVGSDSRGVEVAVRHFDLDGDKHGLFDGTWRHLSLVFDSSDMRVRVFVDGHTNPISPGHMQCLPFMPSAGSGMPADAALRSQFADEITSSSTNGVLLLGYGLQGALDEVMVYRGALSQVAIVEIGGEELLEALRENRGALVAMVVIAMLACVAGAAIRCVRIRRERATTAASDEQRIHEVPAGDGDEAELKPVSTVGSEELAAEDDIDDWLEPHVGAAISEDEKGEADVLQRGVQCLRKTVSLHLTPAAGTTTEAMPASGSSPSVTPNSNEALAAPAPKGNACGEAEEEDEPQGAVRVHVGDFSSGEENADGLELRGKLSAARKSVVSLGGVEVEDGSAAWGLGQSGLKGSQRRKSFCHPRPEVGDPTTWHVFVDPTVVSKEQAVSRLHAWLLRRMLLDAQSVGTAELPPKKAALVERLREIAVQFVEAHHGRADWQWTPEVSALADKMALAVQDDDERGTRNRRLLQLLSATMMLSVRSALHEPLVERALATVNVRVASETDLDAVNAPPRDGLVKRLQAWLKRNLKELTQRLVLLRDFWQVLSLLILATSFPTSTSNSFGPTAAVLGLSFDSQLGVRFAVTFAVCTVLFMGPFVFLIGVVASEMLGEADAGVLEQRLEEQLERQIKRVDGGELPEPVQSRREKVVRAMLMLLTTMYLPTTRVVWMGMFCHEEVLCEYDCYVDAGHKAIVAMGAVIGLCVFVVTPAVLWTLVRRKQREFGLFMGHVTGAVMDESWEQLLVVDVSPFASLYGPYRRTWGQFASVMLFVKALYVVIALQTPPNSTAQLVCLTLMLAAVAIGSAATEPYRYRVCNGLLTLLQVDLLLVLALHVLYRLDPEGLGTPVGAVQTAVIGVTVALHVPSLVGLLGRRRV